MTPVCVHSVCRCFIHPVENIHAQVRGLCNVLRYSFASYLMALTNNPPYVARLMQHKHTSTTDIYEGVATAQDARLYFSITRAGVLLPWETFVARAATAKVEALLPPGYSG